MRQSQSLNLCNLTPESTPSGTVAQPSEMKRAGVTNGGSQSAGSGTDANKNLTESRMSRTESVFTILCTFYAFICSLLISKIELK